MIPMNSYVFFQDNVVNIPPIEEPIVIWWVCYLKAFGTVLLFFLNVVTLCSKLSAYGNTVYWINATERPQKSYCASLSAYLLLRNDIGPVQNGVCCSSLKYNSPSNNLLNAVLQNEVSLTCLEE